MEEAKRRFQQIHEAYQGDESHILPPNILSYTHALTRRRSLKVLSFLDLLFSLATVLSDEKRRRLYDSGLYDPLQDDEEEVEVSSDGKPRR